MFFRFGDLLSEKQIPQIAGSIEKGKQGMELLEHWNGGVCEKSRCAVPCTNRAFMDDVEASGIGSEREADSPVCWKQWKCEQEMERLE
jgi:hypothetical protein